MSANAGRARAPAALRLLEGRGRGRDQAGKLVEEPPPFVRMPPEPPAHLGPHARAEWERVVPELQRLRLLKPIDRAALSAYCEMWEVFVRATEDVHERGLVMENTSIKKDGTMTTWFTQNPAVTVQRNAQHAIRAWCSEFGLTPAAEAKIGKDNTANGNDTDNPFA